MGKKTRISQNKKFGHRSHVANSRYKPNKDQLEKDAKYLEKKYTKKNNEKHRSIRY